MKMNKITSTFLEIEFCMNSLPLIRLLKEFGMSVGDSRVSQTPILLRSILFVSSDFWNMNGLMVCIFVL